ncbi:hypothetical protein C8J24_3000 [Sphingomonas aerolata]|uniref:Uncharacterized protein n=1 Tax=Sphingomonas aerolata TaxID=185951 RepID=A0A2T4YN13_9SPHN|nr:hypothetical protein [Sphingomonas aerolata]PTM44790.1 hypothetical protein C8J24_3000 [Sphingomonas aerolata]
MAGTYPYFADERVILDNADHSNAVFRRCELIYAGGELKLDGALFFDCGISFEGNGERARDLQEAIFASLYEQGYRSLALNPDGTYFTG